MNQEKDLLPVGSIVKLFDGTKRLMIMGRLHRNLENNQIYAYAGCFYPEGYQGGNTYYLFDHSQIECIFFLGLQDEEEFHYRQLLIEQLKQIQNM